LATATVARHPVGSKEQRGVHDKRRREAQLLAVAIAVDRFERMVDKLLGDTVQDEAEADGKPTQP
jgi:hypothetical protein